jgi:hypothetical protein
MNWKLKNYVYVFWDVDGTPIYVGCSGNVDFKRWKNHWKANTRLGFTLRKRERTLGVSLYPEFIEVETLDDAKCLEIFYIWAYGREDLGLGPLFNLTDGGDGGVGCKSLQGIAKSDDHKAALRVPKKHKENMNKHRCGATASAGTRMKMSKTRTGKKHSIERNAKMAASLSKPCTVDEITIFKSKKDLTNKLGKGIRGFRHPNFRYLSPEEVTLWRTQSKKKDVE